MSMMLTFRAGKVAALAVSLSVLAACSREQQDWRSAEASDTVESYGQFLQRHPDSELATPARARLAQLTEDRQWSQAQNADTPEAYRQFLARYPDGKWAQEARIRIQNFALNGLPPAPAPTRPALSTAYVSAPPAPGSARTDVSSANAARGDNMTPAGASGYAIQLGAFTSAAAANDAWQQLTARFGAQLHGLAPRLVEANTVSGSLFRLQAQVADEPKARALCDMLRKQSQACVPVLPQ
jgi:cell division septation protein DedD